MSMPPNPKQAQYQSNNIIIVPTVSSSMNNKPMANVKNIDTAMEPTVSRNEKESTTPAIGTKAASAQSLTHIPKLISIVDHVHPSLKQPSKFIVHPVKPILNQRPASSVDTSVVRSIKPPQSIARPVQKPLLNQPQTPVKKYMAGTVKQPLLNKPSASAEQPAVSSVRQPLRPVVNTGKLAIQSKPATSMTDSVKQPILNPPSTMIGTGKLDSSTPIVNPMKKTLNQPQNYRPQPSMKEKAKQPTSSVYRTPTSIVRPVQQFFPNQPPGSSIHQSKNPSQFEMQQTFSMRNYTQPTGHQPPMPMVNLHPTYSVGYEPQSSSMVYQPPMFSTQHQHQPTSLLYNQQYSPSMVYQQQSAMEYQPVTSSVMYQPPPSSIMYQPTSKMIYQPMSSSVEYQPLLSSMVYQTTPSSMEYQPTPSSGEYQTQPSSMVYQPTPSSVEYQPQSSIAYQPTSYSMVYQPTSSSAIYQPPSSSMPCQPSSPTAVPRSSHLPSLSTTVNIYEPRSFSAEQAQKPTKTLQREGLNKNLRNTEHVNKANKVISWASNYLQSIGHNNTKPIKINKSSTKNKMSQRVENISPNECQDSNKSLPIKEKLTNSSKKPKIRSKPHLDRDMHSKKAHNPGNEKTTSSHFKQDVTLKTILKKNPAGHIQKHKSSTETEKRFKKLVKLDKESINALKKHTSSKDLQTKSLKTNHQKSGNIKEKKFEKGIKDNSQYTDKTVKKLNTDYKNDTIPKRVVGDQSIKPPQTVNSSEQNKVKHKLSGSHDLKSQSSSPIRNVVKVADSPPTSTSKSNPEESFDLRSKLSRVNRRIHNKTRVENDKTCTKKPKLQEDLKIKVGNDKEHLKSPKRSGILKKKAKSKTCKKIKLIINVICHDSGNDTNSNDSSNSESENNPSHNMDLSFLDDFNVDEIVDSLKHSPKHKTKSPQPQINKIENDLKITSEPELKISKIFNILNANSETNSVNSINKKPISETVQHNSSTNENISLNSEKYLLHSNETRQEEVKAEIQTNTENSFKIEIENDNVTCSESLPYTQPISKTHSNNNNNDALAIIKMDLYTEKAIAIKTEDIIIDLTDDADEEILNNPSTNDAVISFDEKLKRQSAQGSNTSKNELCNSSAVKNETAHRSPVTNKENYISANINIRTKEVKSQSKQMSIQSRPSTNAIVTSSHEVKESRVSNTDKNEVCNRTEGNKDTAYKKPVSNNEKDIGAKRDIKIKDVSEKRAIKKSTGVTDTKLNKLSNESNEESSGTNIVTDKQIDKIYKDQSIQKANDREQACMISKNKNTESNIANETESKVVYETIESDTMEKKYSKNTKPETCYPTGQHKALADLLETRMLEYLHRPFKITTLIRQGKNSNIFSCKDENGQSYAAKIFNKGNGRQKEIMLRQLQKDIPPENICTVYFVDGFKIERSWCILTEYYPQNLLNVLMQREKPFHIMQVQTLAKQLISAVMVLRNNGIVHSDIKPSHILVNAANDRLKLCGFDAAYYIDTVKALPNIGTANYRAPEIILGISAGYSIDVWSTAFVIYQMATKKKIFYAGYNNDILFKQMCTFGYLPNDMIYSSPYRDNYFLQNTFIRQCVYRWRRRMLLRPNSVHFSKSYRLQKTLMAAYNDYWSTDDVCQRDIDILRVKALSALLEQMFVLDPRKRLPIEFVCVHPFVFNL